MKKIALYGYGAYGKRVSESFRFFWGEEYTVTAIFDKALAGEKDRFWNLQILAPELMKEEYEKDSFDAVMLCIFDIVTRFSISKWIEELGIPVFFPGKEEDFAGSDFFPQVEEPEITVCEDHYSFHVYKNMLGAIADYNKTVLFLFNEEGKICIDNYKKYYEEYYKPYLLSYPFRLRDPVPEKAFMKGSYCAIVKTHSSNYYHFTYEIADCVYLMEKAGYQGKYIYHDTGFSKDLLQMMGIRSDRLINIRELEPHKVYIFEKLYDINHDGFGPMESSKKVLMEMAERIKKNLRKDDSYPKKIFVKRIGSRRLLNGEETIIKNGYTIMIPEEHSLWEQMNCFYNADIVLTPHGANSTNCLYMHEGAVFAEVFSDQWHLEINAGSCEACGVHYLQLVGKACEGKQLYDIEKDFTVEEAELQHLIEKAEKIVAEEKTGHPV